ncbi:MAG: hypothetical protein HGB03_01805 [Candidatus Yonathbacteria bacterium]|nr:hypothetical protein [Candidatus Yonathbacteria bacterium]NTW47994.1 hypothetical protein [Candidatus Yonathbacteria bacterium]
MFTDKKRRITGEKSSRRRKREDSSMVSLRISKAFDSRADSAEMKRFVKRAEGGITPFFNRLNTMGKDGAFDNIFDPKRFKRVCQIVDGILNERTVKIF